MIQTQKCNAHFFAPLPLYLRWLPIFITLLLPFVIYLAPAAEAKTSLQSGQILLPETKPVLLTVENTTRGLALESLSNEREPFAGASIDIGGAERATRILLFASNLNLLPHENASYFSADAEDGSHRIYQLTVENVELIRNTGLHYLLIKLDKEMNGVGDVLMRISKNGVSSNRVRIGMGHIGAGLPDDDSPLEATHQASNWVGRLVSHPVPSVSGLSSSAVNAGEDAFKLTVYGTGLINSSVVTYNGTNRATKFLNANQVEAQILASDLQTAGQFQIRVFNPKPGGGQSNSLTFNVNQFTPTPTPLPTGGNQFYVTPKGTSSGDGSAANPWDLQTAFNHPLSVKPGDTVWIKGGTYRGVFASKLTGTEAKPIHVRAAHGERPVIDVNVASIKRREVVINGAYAWYWNLEVLDSDPKREGQTAGSAPSDIGRILSSLVVFGHHVKVINPITHDLGNGISFWEKAIDSEIYGAITFNNGWNGPDRGHGHGIYTQNNLGTKSIREVISFNNFSSGAQVYGSNGQANGYSLDGFISFNNGSPSAILSRDPNIRESNLLVGSSKNPSDRIKIANSHLYYPVDNYAYNLRLGYYAPNSQDVKVENSHIIRGQKALFIKDWQAVVFRGNTLWLTTAPRTGPKLIHIIPGAGNNLANYQIDNNRYFDTSFNSRSKSFLLQESQTSYLDFAEWKALGVDQHSTYTQSKPTGQEVFVRPNSYERGRAHIVVYNWTGGSSVSVNLNSAGLAAGDTYEIRDAQDFFGAPVLTGKYSGASVQVPLAKRAVARPIGMNQAPAHTGPEFHVLVLLKN